MSRKASFFAATPGRADARAMLGEGCSDTCRIHSNFDSMPAYVSRGEAPPSLQSAIIPLRRHGRFEAYHRECGRYYKGNVIRDARKAEPRICKGFNTRTFVPDMHAIHTSSDVRQGRPMGPGYRLSIQEMGGSPERYHEPQAPPCRTHYALCFGIFDAIPGYTQGTVVTGERLLGYISLTRMGNLACYSRIIGHADHLQLGIMYRLHFEMMKILFEEDGLEYVMYGAMDSGTHGLRLWKQKVLFEPMEVHVQ